MKSQVKFVCSVCFHQLCRCPKGEVSTLTHSIVPLPQSLTCSVQSLDRLGHRGDMRDDSVETLFQSFPQKARVSSSGMGRDVHSLIYPSSISSSDHSIAHPPRCFEGRFWRVRCGVWHQVYEVWCIWYVHMYWCSGHRTQKEFIYFVGSWVSLVASFVLWVVSVENSQLTWFTEFSVASDRCWCCSAEVCWSEAKKKLRCISVLILAMTTLRNTLTHSAVFVFCCLHCLFACMTVVQGSVTA